MQMLCSFIALLVQLLEFEVLTLDYTCMSM